MKAMVLAAGLGTRLRPLTNDKPKALVEVGGRTMLQITLERLRGAGVREVIVNAHHFAEQLVEYLRAHENFGMRIEVSHEDVLLDTGGGLKQAAWFFRGEDEPFLLHNVDVVSTIDLVRMVAVHRDRGALATLAVRERETSRQLLFDERGLLCGRRTGDADAEMVRSVEAPRPLAFCGIHVMAPRLLETMEEEGVFSIIDTYLRLAAGGERIAAFRADGYYWRDLGKPEQIAAAEKDREQGLWD
ncbi:MAG TPA: nucleotidyltransferase family protein [Acidobacteriaceae bacterium]|nr:nucleotidyltransferase family protein [Acidobacteriaceae bacterium]